MDVARELLVEQARKPSWKGLVLADRQHAGRGRQGRTWASAGGAFIATYIFGVEGGAESLSGYSLACGVALCRSLSKIQAPVQLKWPNDLVTQQGDTLRKIGGILIEVEAKSGAQWVLVGVGLNLLNPPPEFERSASCVSAVRGVVTNVEDLLAPVSTEFASMHEKFVSAGGFKAFAKEWQEASCFRSGSTVVGVDGGSGEVRGVYETVDPSGALVLKVGEERRRFLSGHVSSLSL